MAKSKFPVLTAVAGPSKGKRFLLKKSEYLGGSGKKCSIRLKGDFVAEEHFMVRNREDGNWVVENKSLEGTLVNTLRVETKSLADGDSIQIGTGNVLLFSAANAPRIIAKDGDDPDAASSWSAKKTAIALGVVLYLTAMVFAVLHFSQSSSGTAGGGVSIAQIDEVIAQTTQYIKALTANPGGDAEASEAAVVVTFPSARYFRIIEMQRNNVDEAELELEYTALEEELKGLMYAAYQFAATGQADRAEKAYHGIYDLVPDVRAPVTALALQQGVQTKRNTEK